ncbi:MAG: hypothetical protein ABIF04_08040 [Chloroflexota bacterium]
MRKLTLWIALLSVIALACGTTTVVTPTVDINSIVAQTMAAYTVEALLTQAASPSLTPIPPTDTPTETPTPTSTPQEVAPNPLPATNTGILLYNDQCFNFDNGQTALAPDAQCDVWLAEPALFRQVNGAQLSGYNVSFTPPTRSQCISATFDPTDLAIQTDLHMCFHTNEGQVGFIVVRQYLGSMPFTGIVFDYWVFQ